MLPAQRAESFGDGGELFRLFDLKKGFVGHPAAPVEQARLLNDPLRQINTWPDQGESRRFPRNGDQLSSDRNPLIAHLDGIPDLNSILLHGRLLQKGRPALLISEGGLCWQSFQLSVKGEGPSIARIWERRLRPPTSKITLALDSRAVASSPPTESVNAPTGFGKGSPERSSRSAPRSSFDCACTVSRTSLRKERIATRAATPAMTDEV